MSTTAKELIEAATRLEKAGVGGAAKIEDLNTVCGHILSTVRPDDDEPVTRERLEANEDWRWDESSGLFKNVRRGHIEVSIYKGVASLWAGDEDGHDGLSVDLKSLGHLRRLVAALG